MSKTPMRRPATDLATSLPGPGLGSVGGENDFGSNAERLNELFGSGPEEGSATGQDPLLDGDLSNGELIAPKIEQGGRKRTGGAKKTGRG